MTTPAQALTGDLEPGWSHAEANGYGPCYRRHVPGKGVLRVVARGGGGYAWYLGTLTPAEALSWASEGFAHPRDAMRDADDQVARMAPRMFERLTPGELAVQCLSLARAYDWGRNQGDMALGDVLSELFTQLRIQATDPSYQGPDVYKFHQAVQEASCGAALQAMEASPNRASWIAWRPQRTDAHRAADVTEFPGPAAARGAAPASGGPVPVRRGTARRTRAAVGARPGGLR